MTSFIKFHGGDLMMIMSFIWMLVTLYLVTRTTNMKLPVMGLRALLFGQHIFALVLFGYFIMLYFK